MAQLGILTTEFERPTLESSLDAAVQHRIDTLQFHLGTAIPEVPKETALTVGLPALIGHINAELCDQIATELSTRGLTMAAVDGTFNMVHPDRAQRAAGLGYLRTVIESCASLGTSMVTLCTGSRDPVNMWRRHPENSSAAAWNDLVKSMTEAARCAEEVHVMLAFEPEVNNVVDSAERARRLIEEVGSSHVQVAIDAANIFHEGELPRMSEMLEEAFVSLQGHIGIAHAKDLDHDGDAGHLPAGRGLLDYGLYLALLRKSGFDGAVILHQMHSLPESEIDSCFDFVRGKATASFWVQ